MSKEMIATLGSNPLPIVVSALHHSVSKLHLVVTEEVRELGERVFQLLKTRRIERGEVAELTKAEQQSVEMLRAKLGSSGIPWAQANLDYTGGTKFMSAEVRAYWAEQNKGGTSYYLSQGGQIVRGHKGSGCENVDEARTRLCFDDLVALHFKEKLKCSNEHKTENMREAARKVMDYVRVHEPKGWSQLLPPFRPAHALDVDIAGLIFKVEGGRTLDHKENLQDGGPLVSFDMSAAFKVLGWTGRSIDDVVQELRLSGDKKKRRNGACKWLEGEWLEIEVARRLEASQLFDEVFQDVKRVGGSSGDNFQADVVAVKGYRAYLFSCTTDATVYAKHKLFESTQRATRLGGDYARAAIVSFSENPTKILETVREDGWTGYELYRSFGLAHLKGEKASSRIGADGQAGPEFSFEDALKEWINL